MLTTQKDHIRPIDQAVLDLLRQHQGMTVQELTDCLEVTATAVRQRLERLVEVELVSRTKESVGRGRPVFRYGLTPAGQRYASAGYADLAEALWQEVIELPNPQQRARILRRVAKRMGQGLAASAADAGDVGARMLATVAELEKRKVPAAVTDDEGLPVLEFHACPYPDLADGDDRRQFCEMEQEMLSEAVGEDVRLDRCRLDGHDMCQFRPSGNKRPPE